MKSKKATKRAPKVPPATADQHYRQKMTAIRTFLFELDENLANHAERQAANPENWGLPGDLGRVCTTLRELVASLPYVITNGGGA